MVNEFVYSKQKQSKKKQQPSTIIFQTENGILNNEVAPNHVTDSQPIDDEDLQWEDDDQEPEGCMKQVGKVQETLNEFFEKNGRIIKILLLLSCIVAYFVYFTFALLYHFGDEGRLLLLLRL